MAACNFTINFSGPANNLVQTINTRVAAQGGAFTGDQSGGSFSLSLLGSTVRGSFTISGQQLTVIIDHKPFFISCNQIQNYLQGNL